MHKGVLKKEVLKYLAVGPDKNFIDATAGSGDHSLAVLEKNKPGGKVLGIEIAPQLYQKLAEKKINRLVLENNSYINLKKIIDKHSFGPVAGVLFDLGLSSWHLEESEKGFSFLGDEPLDMRYNKNFTELTAAEIINTWPEEEIKKILRKYSQERFAKKIAQAIIKERKREKINTTSHLVKVIKEAVPPWYKYRKRHCATKTFQALRIVINNELQNIKKALPQAREVLKTGGRIVAISFHSLEDKIVKDYFKSRAKKGLLKILTKKPITPGKQELARNPRSRSAKLRAATKI